MLISDALKQQGILNGYDENQPEEESAIQKETDNIVNGLLSAAMPGLLQPEQSGAQIVEPPQVNAMQGVGSTGSGPFQRLSENGSFRDYFNIFSAAQDRIGLMPGNILLPLFLAGAARKPSGMTQVSGPPTNPMDFLSKFAYGDQIKPEWERYFQYFPEERAKYPKSRI